jgi:hypothetical protein
VRDRLLLNETLGPNFTWRDEPWQIPIPYETEGFVASVSAAGHIELGEASIRW